MRKVYELLKAGIVCVLCLSYATMYGATDGGRFKLVKSTAELTSGDRVIVVNKKGTSNYAMSVTLNSSNNKAEKTEIVVEGETAYSTDNVEVFEIRKSGNYFNLKSLRLNKYLCNNSKSSSENNFIYNDTTYITYSGSKIKTGNIELSFGDDNIAKLLFTRVSSSAGTRCLYYNSAVNSDYFGCYTERNWNYEGNQVRLYKMQSEQLSLSDAEDNDAVISDNKGKVVDVALTRTLVADKWNTFCVPFGIDCANGRLNGVEVRIMEFASVEGNVMCFVEAKDIKPGKAYLIKPKDEDIANMNFEGVVISEATPIADEAEGYSFVGVYSKKTFDATECRTSLFIGADAKFNRPKVDSTMKGMRAYFKCPSEEAASSQLQIGGEPTGIMDIVADVDSDGYIYNINGVCVGNNMKNLGKGLYIRNGKKISIK